MAILVIGAVAYAYLAVPKPPVQVQNIYIWSPDNVCGLNSDPIYYPGFNSSTGANQTLDFYMPNHNSTGNPCTIKKVVTNSTGFMLYNVQVPLTIPYKGTVQMNITIRSPTTSFNGNLNLVFT